MLKNKKGITLIALIITIIVMLILVGVTINVALNGGLFEKAEKATYQTEATLVKEQLEIAKAIETANNEKVINDYSFIKVENLSDLDSKTKNKFKDIILVNAKGEVCYNPAKVTDEEKNMLEEIGIKAYEKSGGGLNVDPKADYIFKPAVGMKYVMNFTEDGDIKVTYNDDDETVQYVKAEDIVNLENDEDGYQVRFYMNLSNGVDTLESDVKLKMDNNNKDVIAYVSVYGEACVYIKYEPLDLTEPIVFGTEDDFVIITEDNRYIQYISGEKKVEAIITKVISIYDIEGYSDWNVVSNGNEFDLYKLEFNFYNGKDTSFIYLTAISKDNRIIYYNLYDNKTIYIGGGDKDDWELNESIDPTPYL